MNFCKAYLLSFLAVFLLSATKTVAKATQSQEEKVSFLEGFSSEVIKSFISLFSSTDSNPAVKASKTSASSCYDFTLQIETDETPEEISWEIKNENTNEIIASQEEGFYTEARTRYTHDEPICLDMDNSDICYKVVLRDTSAGTIYTTTRVDLSYDDEDHNDVYSSSLYEIEERIFCGFDDFGLHYGGYGCLLPDPEPSCACGDIDYCVSNAISLVLFYSFVIVCSPCILPLAFVGFIAYLYVMSLWASQFGSGSGL